MVPPLKGIEDFLLDLCRGGMIVETRCAGALLHSVIQFDGDIQNFLYIDENGRLPNKAELAEHQQKMAGCVAKFGLLLNIVAIGRYATLGGPYLAGCHWALRPHALGWSWSWSFFLVILPMVARFGALPLARLVIHSAAGRVAQAMGIANKEEKQRIEKRIASRKNQTEVV